MACEEPHAGFEVHREYRPVGRFHVVDADEGNLLFHVAAGHLSAYVVVVGVGHFVADERAPVQRGDERQTVGGRQRPAETVRYGCERRSFVVTVAVVGMESRFCVDRYAPRGKVVVVQRFEVARQVIIDERPRRKGTSCS